jgi:hypothetical protein
MKKPLALVVFAGGIAALWWGVETLAFYRGFTETAAGTVEERRDEGVVVRFQSEGPGVERASFTRILPLTERTANLAVGDAVEGFHPVKGLNLVRLDRDFAYGIPIVALGAGALFVVASGVWMLSSGGGASEPPRAQV